MNFLIVKTSAIGDVVQSFPVLEYLKEKFPKSNIDWVVSLASYSLVSSHPLVRKAILFDIDKDTLKQRKFSKVKRFYKALRETFYDAVFDLQGNTKSGLITLCSRGQEKVGFGSKKVAEWPNCLFTQFQYNVDSNINIREQYLKLVQSYFKDEKPFTVRKSLLKIDQLERKKIELIFQNTNFEGKKILVCPSSKWKSKELNINILNDFLYKLSQRKKFFYFFLWGDEKEKVSAEFLHSFFVENSHVLDKMSLPALQNFISRVDCVIAMDSSPLHLCGSVDTRSCSFFGPTSSSIYKPIGQKHLTFQGRCPLSRTFEKRCSFLRRCENPSCIDAVDVEEITKEFLNFLGS